MTNLVTLEQVKQGLAVDSVDDDARLSLEISGASLAVLRYLKKSGSESFYDWDTHTLTGDVPADVQVATIALVGHRYREPDSDDQNAFGSGHLPGMVIGMLSQRREPTLA